LQTQETPASATRVAARVVGLAGIGGLIHAALQAPGLLASQSGWQWAEIGPSIAVESVLATTLLLVLTLPLVPWKRTRSTALAVGALLVVLLVGAALTVRPAPALDGPAPSDQRARTVVLITLDTFRRDHLSAMPGAVAPDLTPNLDALALESTLFTDAYTTAPLTLPSHTTMFTGVAPQVHGVLRNGLMIPTPVSGIPADLADDGFQTGAFVSSLVLHSSHGLSRWFRTYRNAPDSLDLSDGLLLTGPAMRRYRAAGNQSKLGKSSGAFTVDQAVGWLRALPDNQSAFLWVHLYDAHSPHNSHYDTGGVSTWDALASPCDWSAHPAAVRKPPAHPMIPISNTLPTVEKCSQRTWRKLKRTTDAYAEEVRFLDRQIGRLLEELDAAGRDDARIVVAADHGESLVEHQFYAAHQHSLYDPVMRVPMMIRDPSCADCAGAVRSDPVSTVRMAATLRGLAGLDPDTDIAGPSLLERDPEPVQIAIGPAPVGGRRDREKRVAQLQAVARTTGRKVLVDESGHVERYLLGPDALERNPLLLASEQDALRQRVAVRIDPPGLPVHSRDPVRNMLFGGKPPKRDTTNVAEVLHQEGILGELITAEQGAEFATLEQIARTALATARNRDAPTAEGVSDEVRESLEALGYLQ